MRAYCSCATCTLTPFYGQEDCYEFPSTFTQISYGIPAGHNRVWSSIWPHAGLLTALTLQTHMQPRFYVFKDMQDCLHCSANRSKRSTAVENFSVALVSGSWSKHSIIIEPFLLRWSQGAGSRAASQLSLFCCTGPRELDQGIKSLDPQKDPTATNEDAPVRIQVQRQLAQVCRGLDSDPGLQFALSLCREGFTVTNNEHAAQSFCWLLWPVAVLRDHADRAGCWNSSSAPG